MRYFKEPNGDYLAVKMMTAKEIKDRFGDDVLEAFCAATAGDPSTVQTRLVSRAYLEKCAQVSRRDVPLHWLRRF